jgi:hypothetical protein
MIEAGRQPAPSFSEHGVLVGGLFRNRLDHVPVLDDLAVLDAENIDDRLAAVVSAVRRMYMQPDEIAVGRAADDLRLRLRIVLEEAGEEGNERLLAIRNLGIVLPVLVHHDRCGLDIMAVEEAVVELHHQLPVGFLDLQIPRGGKGAGRHGDARQNGECAKRFPECHASNSLVRIRDLV